MKKNFIWTMKRKMILVFGGITFTLFITLGIILLFITNSQIKKNISHNLQNTTQMIKDDLTNIINTSVINYLKAIAEKNKEIAEYFYQQFKIGKITENEAKKRVEEIMLSQKIGQTGYIFCLNSKGTVQVHPKNKGNNDSHLSFIKKIISQKKGYLEYQWKDIYGLTEVAKSLYMTYFDKWDWIISVSSYREELTHLIDPNIFKEKFLSIKIGETGYPYIIDYNGIGIIHPLFEGKNAIDFQDSNRKYFIKEIMEKKDGNILYYWKNPGETSSREKFAYFSSIPEIQWIIVISTYTEEFYGLLYKIRNAIFVAFLISLTIMIFVIFIYSKNISRPIIRIKGMLKDISRGEGDLTKKIPVESKDELGEMAQFFNDFIDTQRNIVSTLKQESAQLSFAAVDLASNSEQTAAGVQEISASSHSVLQSVNNETNMIKESTTHINDILADISKIDKMTEEMKNQIAQSSSAIEEMAANISSSADMANKANEASEKLDKSSQEGNHAIQTLTQSIEDVSKNSDKIVEMVQLIMDIAEQTNLLAMNAAIEAAHAGEYGKGFAVVAEEIRKLADKSGKSAKEIQQVVKIISTSIQQNLKLSDQTKINFDILKKEIDKVMHANQEIAAAMGEQKIANKSVLDASNSLNNLSDKIVEDLKIQVMKGKNINDALRKLNIMSEEIATAMSEQKGGLDEAASSAENINNISLKLKGISSKIEEDFKKFRTE